MKKTYTKYISFALILLLGCSLSGKDQEQYSTFEDYWYQGKAEITSFTLQQAHYGEIHQGNAVMIFVTEDLSEHKQVKLDDPESADDAVPVLKLNASREFTTGIYTYEMMTSVFTPVDREQHPYSLKVTNSSQEWCGQSFTQINKTDQGYDYRLFSYFESEGDQKHQLKRHWLEDEFWTMIRISPDKLPTGEQQVIPGTIYQRLSHAKVKAYTAEITQDTSHATVVDYIIDYPELERKLEIRYEKKFPYKIQSWIETRKSDKGKDGEELITRAIRDKTLMTDYWNKNNVKDASYRSKLNLR